MTQNSPGSVDQDAGEIRGRIVNLLADFQTLTPQDLAAGLDLDVETVTSHLQVLQAWGWIIPVPGFRLTTNGRSVAGPSIVAGN